MQHLSLAFTGGSVFDGTGSDPVRTDVGVTGDRITAVGIDEVAAGIGPETRVIELDGRMLLPGIIDAHVHPVEGGIERLGCDLSSGYTREDYLRIVREYVEAHPDTEWIIGGGWQMAAFPDGFPLASDLDEICADRPMLISNRDHHSTWANSEALRRAGITSETPDPEDGRIERDADGNPSGTLHEGARMLTLRFAPEPTRELMYAGLMSAQEYLHAYGITAWQDALIGDYGNHSSQEVQVYREAIERDEFHARANGAIWWDRNRGAEDEDIDAQIDELEALRREFHGDRFSVTTVKIMQDGVVENRTAAVIEPYLAPGCEAPQQSMPGGCACGDPADTGISFLEPETLNRVVTRLDALGIQVHIHAIGDRGVRESLDAVEAA
ncbi:MAG: amidohydrolase family protein, partial [Actinobacteria bacterium]|nr:amidohydrolase family protein [Actinomycetota bacterium]